MLEDPLSHDSRDACYEMASTQRWAKCLRMNPSHLALSARYIQVIIDMDATEIPIRPAHTEN